MAEKKEKKAWKNKSVAKDLLPEQDMGKVLADDSEKPVRKVAMGDIAKHPKFHKFIKGNE